VIKAKHGAIGITLIEVIFVLAIFSIMVVYAVRVYKTLQIQVVQVEQVKSNVNQLFEAGSVYYKAQCRANPATNTALLDPANGTPVNPTVPAVVSPFVIHINSTGSASTSYGGPPYNDEVVMASTFISPQLIPFVNSTDPVNPPFVLQLNRVVKTTKTRADGIVAPVEIWEVQVSVLLTPAAAAIYQQLLGADCLSSPSAIPFVSLTPVPSQIAVYPCGKGPVGNYAVWQRAPFVPPTTPPSSYATTTAVFKQIQQDILAQPVTFPSSGLTEYQDYLCSS
jgi:type II secretory pathway pseudopilin PulG